jgi:glycosyltransferase involved in cell wall biosynthesis
VPAGTAPAPTHRPATGAGRPAPKIAIVHERFTELGGSEAVVATLHGMWPDSQIFAPLVDPRAVPASLRGLRVHGSRLQRLYRGGRHTHLLPFLPSAIARLPLGTPDLVIISHHSFAHRVRVPAGIPVLSYVHSPARWIWEPASRSDELRDPARRGALAVFAAAHRRSDRAAAARPDMIVANSQAVRDRITRWWGRRSTVVYPPVDVRFFTPGRDSEREDFYLLAGRLIPGKNPEIAVRAANRHGFRLVVAGDGRMRAGLSRLAGPNVSFLGRVDRPVLRDLFRRCRAVLVPGEEDFGMIPVEAAACGAPVVAVGVGGVLESVVPGRTGVVYPRTGDAVADLVSAIRRLQRQTFDRDEIRSRSLRFSTNHFVDRMRAQVEALLRG